MSTKARRTVAGKLRQRLEELEAERDEATQRYQAGLLVRDQLKAELERLRKYIELLEEDIRCYQADL